MNKKAVNILNFRRRLLQYCPFDKYRLLF